MRILIITPKEAAALGDPIRIEIMKLLQRKANTVNFVYNNPKFMKAKTTIRHHFKILHDAKLIKITKMVEKKGAFLKYYKSTVKIQEPKL